MVRPKKETEPTQAETKALEPRQLTVVESFYIEQHANTLSVEEIARDLNLPVEDVSEVVEAIKKPEEAPETPRVKRHDSMFERTLGKKKHGTGGAVVMTEAASERVNPDGQVPQSRLSNKYVFQPKGGN